MRVSVRFLDGEVLEGESDAATPQKMGFPVRFEGGNNQIAWVSMGSIKYVMFKSSVFEQGMATDPRAESGLTKVVLHFVDGETMRTFKDDTFAQEGEGFYLRVWDDKEKALYRVLVSLHGLKAIFFVHQWDSRTEDEKSAFRGAPTPPASEHRSGIGEAAQRQVEALRPDPE